MINRLQVKWFACYTNYNLFIFPVYYLHNRKNEGESIICHNTIKIHNKKHSITGSDLLYHYKKMSYIIIVYICTLLGIINKETVIAWGVISYLECTILTFIEVKSITSLNNKIQATWPCHIVLFTPYTIHVTSEKYRSKAIFPYTTV